MENFNLKPEKFENAWLVQLATCTKTKVTSQVKQCLLNLDGYPIMEELNILPLGSYNLIIGMDWLERQANVMNFLERIVTCVSLDGLTRLIKGKPKLISSWKIPALQLKICSRKGCRLYLIQTKTIP